MVGAVLGTSSEVQPDPTHCWIASFRSSFTQPLFFFSRFSQVWLASYCQTLVAVKIASRARHANLTATLQQQETLRNLRNEASLMATLNHPNSE